MKKYAWLLICLAEITSPRAMPPKTYGLGEVIPALRNKTFGDYVQHSLGAEKDLRRLGWLEDRPLPLQELYALAYEDTDAFKLSLNESRTLILTYVVLPFLLFEDGCCIHGGAEILKPFMKAPDALIWLQNLKTWAQKKPLKSLFFGWADAKILLDRLPSNRWDKFMEVIETYPTELPKLSALAVIRHVTFGTQEAFLKGLSFQMTPTIRDCFERHILRTAELAALFSGLAHDAAREEVGARLLKLSPQLLLFVEPKALHKPHFLSPLEHPLIPYLLQHRRSHEKGRMLIASDEECGPDMERWLEALWHIEQTVFFPLELPTLGMDLLSAFSSPQIEALTTLLESPDIRAFLPEFFNPLPSYSNFRPKSFEDLKYVLEQLGDPLFQDFVQGLSPGFRESFIHSLMSSL